MPTVQEILKASGFTDEQITAMDTKAITAFGTVLTTAQQAEQSAQQAREQAALERRIQEDKYTNEISPALDKWANESAQYKAEIAFYRAQNETARSGGFIPTEAPGYTPSGAPAGSPARGANGEYVAGGSGVPGSPTYMTPDQGIRALSNAHWSTNEHLRLYGTPPPDDFETLVAEATRQRMDFKPYVEAKYKFGDKRNEISTARAKEHDDKIRTEATAEADKKWAERMGNNPNVRVGGESQFSEINKGIQGGQIKDPTTFKSKEERRAATTQLIHKDIAENMAGAGR